MTRFLSLFLSLITVLCAQDAAPNVSQQPAPIPAPDASELKIVIVAGQGAINSKNKVVQPVIEVRDKNSLPVPGAVVNFTAPRLGPSATFSNGGRTQSLVSDTNGRVAVNGMTPDGGGTFKLTVTATYDRNFATAEIIQTNNAGGQSETGGLSRRAKVGIFAGVAAAAAVGLTVGLRGSSSSQQTGSIGVGTPTVGAPH